MQGISFIFIIYFLVFDQTFLPTVLNTSITYGHSIRKKPWDCRNSQSNVDLYDYHKSIAHRGIAKKVRFLEDAREVDKSILFQNFNPKYWGHWQKGQKSCFYLVILFLIFFGFFSNTIDIDGCVDDQDRILLKEEEKSSGEPYWPIYFNLFVNSIKEAKLM